MMLGEARTPPGMRLYAIGDVHGCDALLAAMHERIAEDLAANPPADHRLIHIGDYVDRGPHSAAVVARLAALSASDPRVLCLRGNHEQMMLDFLADPDEAAPRFLANGGRETLASYGVAFVRDAERPGYAHLAHALRAVLPERDRVFLEGLPLTHRFGDFLFVHAGIRPRVPLDAQHPHDLIWIRREFLDDAGDHGVVVVHGHTPVERAEPRPNRIAIDTGAVFTGRLTCLALDGTTGRIL
ncbi:MAG: metallophosphoesterase family protein [Bauldia sp.]